jgi:hypothetical protein
MVEHLLCKCEALSLNPRPTPSQKRKKEMGTERPRAGQVLRSMC